MLTIYGMSESGNCYKLKLAAAQLQLPHRWVETDTRKGETRTPEYLAKNPNGKVPLLGLEDGSHLAESNAILHYLADGTPLLPSGRAELPRLQERGNQALAVMQQHLAREPFFAAGRYTIADIALYAYTHVAADGGFEFERYPALRAWLKRVEQQPRYVAMG
jgi:glutathione S-transferase